MKYLSIFPVVFFMMNLYAASPNAPFSVDQYTVALWHFDENSGDSAYDASGHGNSGKIYGAQRVQGVFGSALQFDGTDSIKILDNPSLHLQTVTVEAWIYSDNFAATYFGVILTKEYGNMASYRLSNFRTTGGITFVTNNNWGNEIASSQPLQNQTWHYVSGVSSNGFLKIYIDGSLVASGARNSLISYDNSPLLIGANQQVPSESFVGKIDEIRISSIDRFAPAPISLIPYVPNPTYNQLPVLRWHPDSSVSVYKIQIDTTPYFLSPIIMVPTADTFFTPLAALPYDTYYWRVGDNTDNSNWSTISSLTIQDSLVPILIPYSPDPTWNRKPVLAWHPVNGASSYTIQISTAPTFLSLNISNIAADTSYAPQASLPIGTIYWRVKSNLSSQYSIPDTFTVLNDSIPWLIPMVPDTQYNLKPQFRWHPAVGASTYIIQIDTLGNFFSPFTILPLNDTTYTPIINLPLGRICWRVGVEINSIEYSSVDTFWTVKTTGVAKDLFRAATQSGPMSINNLRQGISITYLINEPGTFSLNIYSLAGRCVASLGQGTATPGNRTIQWNGTNQRGAMMPEGNYVAVCKLNNQTIAKKFVLVR
jgi:hypothetical protein